MTPGWTWFFALAGLVGLLLAVPMSVLGNMLTPKVQHWWATTSKARQDRRIAELRSELTCYQRFNSDDRDELLSEIIRRLSFAGVCAVVFLAGLVMTGLEMTAPQQYHIESLNETRSPVKRDLPSQQEWRINARLASQSSQRLPIVLMLTCLVPYFLCLHNARIAVRRSRRLSPERRKRYIGVIQSEIEALTTRNK